MTFMYLYIHANMRFPSESAPMVAEWAIRVHVFHLHLTFITEFTSVHVFLEHMPVCICALS